jgi:hypothetical protein
MSNLCSNMSFYCFEYNVILFEILFVFEWMYYLKINEPGRENLTDFIQYVA